MSFVQIDGGKIIQSELMPVSTKMGDFTIYKQLTVFQDDDGVFTDYTTAAADQITNDVILLPVIEAINDAIYFGLNERFFGLIFDISTFGVGDTIVWEYYNGTSWISIPSLTDETIGFTTSGFTGLVDTTDSLANWTKTIVNATDKYWWRARVTAANYTTQPKAKRVQVTNFETTVSGIGFRMISAHFISDICTSDCLSISYGIDNGISALVLGQNAIHASNVLTGIVPTATNWGVTPTDLANCTDGDFDSVTGTGTKTLTAAGGYGEINFDLGEIPIYPLLIYAKIGLWSTDNAVDVRLDHSVDGITYNAGQDTLAVIASTTEKIFDCTNPAIVRTRYFRLRYVLRASDGSTGCNAKIYEVHGIPIGNQQMVTSTGQSIYLLEDSRAFPVGGFIVNNINVGSIKSINNDGFVITTSCTNTKVSTSNISVKYTVFGS